jgi:2-polyprenyl-6-methoxyphenol hydroxylase-like FAD-dependent oxidoreductase
MNVDAVQPASGAKPEFDVVIVGAGIAGLTAALTLCKLATRVTLLEQTAQPAEVGAGIMLQPNGLAVLDGLGLRATITEHGRPARTMEIYNHRNRLIGRGTMPDFGGGLDHYTAVLRSDLHGELLRAVQREPTITTRFGTRATRADRNGTIWTDEPGDELLTANLIVGADGVHSVIRASGDFAAEVSNRQTTYVRGLVPAGDSELFAEYWTPLGAFGAAPVGRLTYFYAAGYREPAAAALERRDLTAFSDVWRKQLPVAGEMLDRVREIDQLLVNGVRRVRCRRWVDGKLVLIGDAAHAMAPNLGQGANSAMVDAAVLAVELANRSSIEHALARYETRRLQKVTSLQRIADDLAQLSGLAAGWRITIRDMVIRQGIRLPRLMESQIRRGQQEDPLALRSVVQRLTMA